jgi:IS30 family transposase
MSETRRREKAKPKIPEETYDIINDLIEKDWSPEQISGWLAAEKNMRISHERIAPAHRPRQEARRKLASSLHAAERKEKNVMEALTGGVRSGIVCR